MKEFTVGPNHAGQRFDKFLRKCLPAAGDGFLFKMLRKKNITLNGKKAEGREILQAGDEVRLFLSDETYEKFADSGYVPMGDAHAGTASEGNVTAGKFPGSRILSLAADAKSAYGTLAGISVLYEDPHVLILNKPVGILSQKAAPEDLSLNEWMIGYLLQGGKLQTEELALFRPSVVNRLDRNTSGLVLCGKSLEGSRELSRILRERTVRKFYRTIVAGKLKAGGELKGVLVKDEKHNKVGILASGTGASLPETVGSGSPVHTVYRPLADLGDATYLEVELITGKTHQIRAHLASIGHPVLGDNKYGDKAINQAYRAKYRLTTQLLHAYRLEFQPCDGALANLGGKTILAPLPRIFRKILREPGEI